MNNQINSARVALLQVADQLNNLSGGQTQSEGQSAG
jgi:hypothetical protein